MITPVFFKVIDCREGERDRKEGERERTLVANDMYPDQRSNLKPWCNGDDALTN